MRQETNEMSAIDAMLSSEFGDIAHMVHLHAQERPDHAALVQGETRWSYGALDAVMDAHPLVLVGKIVRQPRPLDRLTTTY